MTATNTSKPAKDGSGASFTLEMAAESVSQNIAQKTYIGSPSTEALVEPPTQADVKAITTALGTPAQDGTDATGVTPPAGAVGIRGWLSSIYNKLTGSLAVTGTFWPATQPISAASLPLPAGAATAANQPTAAAQGSATSGQTGRLMQGAVTTAAPAYTTAQTSPLSLDTAGNLRVNVVAGSASGNVAQGSTTSGETGVMIQGAVTRAAPSYTTAQTSPVSLTTAGAVRTDASATTQPVSGAITANAGTNLNTSALALESGGNLASIKTNTAITAAGTTATSGAPVQGMTGGVAMPMSSTDGAILSLGAIGDAAWTGSGNATGIALWKAIYSAAAGSVPAGTNSIGAVTGAAGAALALDTSVNGLLVAQGSTTAGQKGLPPLQLAISTFQPSLTNGQTAPASGTNIGELRVKNATMINGAIPVVTSNGIYSAGNQLGGVTLLNIPGSGGGELRKLSITSKSILTTSLTAYLFFLNPTNTTWTDKTTPSINAADLPNVLAAVPLGTPLNALGTMSLWTSTELSICLDPFVSSIFIILIVSSAATLTSASTSDIHILGSFRE